MTQPFDRERAALVAIVEAILADRARTLAYHIAWTYRVTGTDDGPPVTISAKSQDPRMPDLARIVLRQGPDGGYATPAEGSLIAVAFLNADPSLPYVHSLDPTATVVKSWQHAATLVELGDALATALAHSTPTSATFTAISTLIAAIGSWTVASVTGGGTFNDPGRIATSVLETAIATATAAIAAQAASIPTTIVKGT